MDLRATPSDALAWIFAINTHRRHRGAVSLPDLTRAENDTPIMNLISHSRSVTADADLDEIVRAMTDYASPSSPSSMTTSARSGSSPSTTS